MKWIDHYKYITYTTPDGQRFRDNRLLNDKYQKTNMEELFAYKAERKRLAEGAAFYIRAGKKGRGL